MDVIDAVCLWAVHQKMRRRRQMRERKYWVHPILNKRLSHSLYIAVTSRVTYAFIPNIQWVLAQQWFSPTHFSEQFLTGHGAFQAYLHRFSISGVVVWDCNGSLTEDSWHVLLPCPLHTEPRLQLTEDLCASGIRGPWNAADLVASSRSPVTLERFARAILS
ncbi:Hypothetical protein CINCED_3A010494 [Cinara cedri]|uniref:Uncharacterized protein n=1 Tax=Cinara cedri TaxID=506608 RepID=A0A5E4MX13_9HEMI|nr:Hypothetical protein CINCED_3A010494 [Cinara cedri]